ncbi:MAG: PilZ domain-containing protein [Gemmatimonadales bacterium]
MSSASEPSQPSPREERRLDIRLSFVPARRPFLQLPDGAYPVLDVSRHGLRLRHVNPVRPEIGIHIAGMMAFPDQRPPLSVEGIVVRVQAADVGIACAEGILPAEWILEEAAHARTLHPGALGESSVMGQ